MALKANYKLLTIESIKEMVIVLEYCFNFDKKTSDQWESQENGILGIPALVLISSIIDTMGSYFSGTEMEIVIDGEIKHISKAAEHSFILNHPTLFNFNWSMKAIMDFYSNYRSVATHNSTLPQNNFIEIEREGQIVDLNPDGSIKVLYLLTLFNEIKRVLTVFYSYVDANYSEEHKLTKNIEEKGKPFTSVHSSITISGNTNS